MQAAGQLHTIDVNEELNEIQKKYFDKSGFGQRIVQHVGDAKEIIPQLDLDFDLVFIDAEKSDYPAYFELASPKQSRVVLYYLTMFFGRGKS